MLLVALPIVFAPAQSATIYRSLDADGKVIYSDKPPASGKVQKTLDIANAPSTPLPESVLRYQAELAKSMNRRLAEGAAPPSIM